MPDPRKNDDELAVVACSCLDRTIPWPDCVLCGGTGVLGGHAGLADDVPVAPPKWVSMTMRNIIGWRRGARGTVGFLRMHGRTLADAKAFLVALEADELPVPAILCGPCLALRWNRHPLWITVAFPRPGWATLATNVPGVGARDEIEAARFVFARRAFAGAFKHLCPIVDVGEAFPNF